MECLFPVYHIISSIRSILVVLAELIIWIELQRTAHFALETGASTILITLWHECKDHIYIIFPFQTYYVMETMCTIMQSINQRTVHLEMTILLSSKCHGSGVQNWSIVYLYFHRWRSAISVCFVLFCRWNTRVVGVKLVD